MTSAFKSKTALAAVAVALVAALAAVPQITTRAQTSNPRVLKDEKMSPVEKQGIHRAADRRPPGASAGAPQPYSATARSKPTGAVFNAKGQLLRPVGWRDWPFIGTPITPNGLNKPVSSFPEFHIVYVDPVGYEHYRRTGTFKDGTMIVKELTLVQKNATTDGTGSTEESSGRGYFMAEYSGLETSVKDSKRFAKSPGKWAYFTFGHVAEAKYKAVTGAEPDETCNACHAANAAEDFVFSQHYPVLRGLKKRVVQR